MTLIRLRSKRTPLQRAVAMLDRLASLGPPDPVHQSLLRVARQHVILRRPGVAALSQCCRCTVVYGFRIWPPGEDLATISHGICIGCDEGEVEAATDPPRGCELIRSPGPAPPEFLIGVLIGFALGLLLGFSRG